MEVHKFLCACGSGVGCSLMLESHVMSRDLGSFANSFPEESKVVLNDLVDANELNEKLSAAFSR